MFPHPPLSSRTRVISANGVLQDYNKMKSLKTPFKQGGRITAANASQISDGAGAVMLVSGMVNSWISLFTHTYSRCQAASSKS
jgi:acetyl-CoA acetyltransferase